MLENQLTLVSEDGKEELAEILFTYEKDDVKYVVFELVESLEISAARFLESDEGEGRILDIETDEEWEMLDKLLEQYFDELEEAISEEDLFNKE